VVHRIFSRSLGAALLVVATGAVSITGVARASAAVPRYRGGTATPPIATGPLVAVSSSTGGLIQGFPRVSTPGTVFAIADDGQGGWYVGGHFKSVAGVACQNLVHIRHDLTVDRAWCPRPKDDVRALVRIRSTLYVGSDNMSCNTGECDGLAAFDTTTGRITSWHPKLKESGGEAAVYNMAPDPSGSLLYVAGTFSAVGGAPRSNFAAISASSGRATPFAPNPDTDRNGDSVDAFAVTKTRVYAWGYYAHIGGEQVRGATAALDPRSGKVLAWRPGSDGGPYATLVTGGSVIIGGAFSRLDGKVRDDLASFGATTGAVDAWAPQTGPNAIAEFIAPWKETIFAVLTHDHWSSGQRRLVAYDRNSGRVVWRSSIRLDDAVYTTAASGDTILVGGLFKSATVG